MRLLASAGAVLLAASVAHLAHAAASASAPAIALIADPTADDPKIARVAPRTPAATAAAPSVLHVAPAFQVAYRRFSSDGPDHHDITFHEMEVDFDPISIRWLRLGLEVGLGFGSGTTGAYFATTGISAGVQYPARVTPFVEAHADGGVIGATVLSQTVASYAFAVGVDAGFALYLVSRLYVSGSIGWLRFGYRGVDAQYQIDHPSAETRYLDVRSDALTLRVGIGL